MRPTITASPRLLATFVIALQDHRGAFVPTELTLAADDEINVRVIRGTGSFWLPARVVGTRSGAGAGRPGGVFVVPLRDNEPILARLLRESGHEGAPLAALAAVASHEVEATGETLSELVRIAMGRRGIIQLDGRLVPGQLVALDLKRRGERLATCQVRVTGVVLRDGGRSYLVAASNESQRGALGHSLTSDANVPRRAA